jgi:site-specific DNA-methyltransferase (adenine-specific)
LYNIEEIKNTIIQGHALDVLKEIPDDSIDMVITSPPYWGLRNYNTNPIIWDNHNNCEHEWQSFVRKGQTGGTKSLKVQIKEKENFQIVKDSIQGFCVKCGAWAGELGSEPNFQLYIQHLFEIFNEVKRILKFGGSCWINLGDSYSGSAQGAGADRSGVKQGTNRGTLYTSSKDFKSLLLNTGITNKSLIGIPDRFKITMIDNGWICRNEIIWYKPNAMVVSAKDRFTVDFEKLYFFTKNKKYYFKQQLEPYTSVPNHKPRNKSKEKYKDTELYSQGERDYYSQEGRNKRSVWTINTKPLKDAHFATFPPKLVDVPIDACCPIDGIVLDIFFGSGTTGLVAKQQNKNYIGIELNPEYIEIANKRLQ